MKTLCSILLLCSLGIAQDAPKLNYWTTRRTLETIGVTSLHLADAAQTCYHEKTTPGWRERSPTTPGNCAGASVFLIGSGPLLQFASYRITRKYPDSKLWRAIDRGIPHLEMTLSVNAIHCSNTKAGCNHYGF